MFESRWGQECFLHFVQTGSEVHSTSHPMATVGSFPWVKRLEREADHSPPTSAEIKKTWIYTSIHDIVLNYLSTGTTLLSTKRDFSCQRYKKRHIPLLPAVDLHYWPHTPLLSVGFPCGILSLSLCSYIACYFWLVAQSAATCSRWFTGRGFFYSEDGGDTFLRNVG
jgi:hypothetical protein